MSVTNMSRVFYTPIPTITIKRLQKGEEKPIRISKSALKITLLALADHSNDEGEGAYPSMSRLELKTGLSRPTVSHALRALRQEGYISYVGISKRGTSNYSLNLDALAEVPKSGSKLALPAPEVVKPVNQGQESGFTSASKTSLPDSSSNHPQSSSKGAAAPAPETAVYVGAIPMAPRKEGESEEAYARRLQQAHDLQKSMLAQQGQVDLSWLLPPLQVLAREYCRVTGCVPIKRDRNNWNKEIGTWVELGFTPQTVKDAYHKLVVVDQLTCGGPESLTKTGRSLVNAARAGVTGYSEIATTKMRVLQDGRVQVGNKFYPSVAAYQAQA